MSSKNFKQELFINPPVRGRLTAWILVAIAGPFGLFYTTVLGGVIMSLFGLVAFGMWERTHSFMQLLTVWLVSMIWAMLAVNHFDRKLLKQWQDLENS